MNRFDEVESQCRYSYPCVGLVFRGTTESHSATLHFLSAKIIYSCIFICANNYYGCYKLFYACARCHTSWLCLKTSPSLAGPRFLVICAHMRKIKQRAKFLADDACSCFTATAPMASGSGGPVSADSSLCLIHGTDSD